MSPHSHTFKTLSLHIIKHIMIQLSIVFHIAGITLTFPLTVPTPRVPTLDARIEINVYVQHVDVQMHLVGLRIGMRIGRVGEA